MKPAHQPDSSVKTKRIQSAVIIVGGLVWRILEGIEHIDLILSLNNQRVQQWLGLFRNLGLLIILSLLLVMVWRGKRTPVAAAHRMTLIVGTLALLWGIFLGIYLTENTPQLMLTYGHKGPACRTILDTGPIAELKEKYDVVVACGFIDPRIEREGDDRLTLSNAFAITGGPVLIEAPFSSKTMRRAQEIIQSEPGTSMFQFGLWFVPIVLPKGVSLDKIQRLSDVEKYGGRELKVEASAEGYPPPPHS